MPLNPIGLTRYDSAPDSFLSNLILPVVDDVNLLIGTNRQFFPPGDSHSEPSCNVPADPTILSSAGWYGNRTEIGIHNASYYTNAVQIASGDLPMSSCRPIGHGSGMSSQLFRHSSSPAEFLSNVMVDNGLTVTRGGARCSAPLLKSQLSFSSRQGSITHASEIISSDDVTAEKVGQTYMASNIQIGSWDDSDSFILSAPSAINHGNDSNEDIMASLSNMIDSHTYDLSNNPVDMANAENLFVQEEIVPCRIRAKRGCATHPRSIAERERRTRISEKLRKLQELVPNMDKQTSTADMLDLAVQHIKGLQSQIQNLNEETAICTCSSKQDMNV